MKYYYFAYGSNLLEEEIQRTCNGEAKYICNAILQDYRLAFTRKSQSRKGGVADIIKAKHMKVHGAIYEVNENSLQLLDKREGVHLDAYRRVSIDLESLEFVFSEITDERIQLADDEIEIVSYEVVNKSSTEITPTNEYFDIIIEGAVEKKLDPEYVLFLNNLKKEFNTVSRNSRLIVKPTIQRKQMKGVFLIRLEREIAERRNIGDFCVISYFDKACIAYVEKADTAISSDSVLDQNYCEIDQSIRYAISDLKSRKCYGNSVEIWPIKGKIGIPRLIQPRTLLLPLYRPSVFDSEINICVLSNSNIKLLGLEEGDYIEVISAVYDEKKRQFSTRKLTRRVFSGSVNRIKRIDTIDVSQGKKKSISEEEYPETDKIYIDYDGRQELGLHKEVQGYPVLVRGKVRKLLLERLIFYGITFVFSIDALISLFQLTGMQNPLLISFIALSLAIFITVTISILDLKSIINY